MENPELVGAVKTVKRNAAYRTWRARLHSKTPSDVWSEGESGSIIVSFDAGPDVLETFHGMVAFTVDPTGGEVSDVAMLSVGLAVDGWRVVNSGGSR